MSEFRQPVSTWRQFIIVVGLSLVSGCGERYSRDVAEVHNGPAATATSGGAVVAVARTELRRRLASYHADLAEEVSTYIDEGLDLPAEVRQVLLYGSFPDDMTETADRAATRLNE